MADPKMSSETSIRNTQDLRKMLIDTIESVRRGDIDSRQANAIAVLSRQILQSAKLDLDVLRFNVTHEKAIEAGDRVLQLVAS